MVKLKVELVTGLLVCLWLSEGHSAFEMTQCNSDGHFDIVPGQRQSITCSGMQHSNNIYWAIDREQGQDGRFMQCESCHPDCPKCYSLRLDNEFSVTRERTNSTLTFVSNLQQNEGALLTCSNFAYDVQVSCWLHVIQAYRMPSCYEDWLEVLDDGSTGVECNGLMGEQSMYWTISTDGNVHRIAECNACQLSGRACPCAVNDTDFNVTREADISRLYVLGDVIGKNGSTLSCVKEDLATYAQCQMSVITKPDKLKLDEKTCPTYVPEGSQLRCACGHSLEWGSPRAYVSWNWNTNSSVLTVQNVNMTLNGSVFVCRSVWGRQKAIFEELNYTVLVAYGPYNITLTRPANVTDDLDHVTFTCMSSAASPSVTFEWNAPCATSTSGEQVSTCSVRTEDLVSRKEVRCSAYNSAVTELRQTASLVLPGTGQAQDSGGLSPAVAGAVGAVVAVVIIATVVIIVFVVRRRGITKRASPRKDPSAPANEEFVEYHNNTYNSSDLGLDATSNDQGGFLLSMQPMAAKGTAEARGTLYTDPPLQAGTHNMDADISTELYANLNNHGGSATAKAKPAAPGGSVDMTSGGNDVSNIYAQVQKPMGNKRKADDVEKSDFVEYQNFNQSMDQAVDVVGSSHGGFPAEAKNTAGARTTLHTDPPTQAGPHDMDTNVYIEMYANPRNHSGTATVNAKSDVPEGSVSETSGKGHVPEIRTQVQKPKASQHKADYVKKSAVGEGEKNPEGGAAVNSTKDNAGRYPRKEPSESSSATGKSSDEKPDERPRNQDGLIYLDLDLDKPDKHPAGNADREDKVNYELIDFNH